MSCLIFFSLFRLLGLFFNQREHLPTTPYDNRLDRKSINPRLHAYEKFISGMYLGEITRHMLMSLVDAAPRSLLFGGKVTTSVNGQWGFDTSVMSAVEEAWRGPVDDPTYQADIKKIPVFKDFDEYHLVPEVKTRLERVRRVVIDSLGYDHGDISLKDAAVSITVVIPWITHLTRLFSRSYDGLVHWSHVVPRC